MSMGQTTMRTATGAGGEGASQGWGARLAARPLFMCGFRPFFLLTALYAVLVLLAWSGFLGFGLAVPAVAGGPFVWHAHELMFGFGLAAVAGFVLTAVPEFTATPAFAPRVVLRFVLLWLAARAAFWFSGALAAVAGGWLDGADGQAARWLGHLPAALLEIGFACALLAAVAPRLWRDPERRQLGFLWGL
ncbi:MAG TPA: NnrS family protein, partial [Thauera phenylacetica]|nr:NnrS family protein [Thauera phenylacetica]